MSSNTETYWYQIFAGKREVNFEVLWKQCSIPTATGQNMSKLQLIHHNSRPSTLVYSLGNYPFYLHLNRSSARLPHQYRINPKSPFKECPCCHKQDAELINFPTFCYILSNLWRGA